MRMRRLAGTMLAAGFIALVVHAAAAMQCPARELGACARVHAMLMQKPAASVPVVLATEPMRGAARHG